MRGVVGVSRRAPRASAGPRRRVGALAVGLLMAGMVLVPVSGPAAATGSANSPLRPGGGTVLLGQPAGLSVDAEAGSLAVSVDWDDVAGADSYKVRWREGVRGTKLNEGISVASSQADITVADYGEWIVKVFACNGATCGRGKSARFQVEALPEPASDPTTETAPESTTEPAPEATPEPVVEIPAKPTGLGTGTTAGSLDVSVDWDDVTGADDYRVRWRRHGPGQALNAGVSPTSSNETITVAGYGRWVVRVEACNTAGCSSPAAAGFTVEAAPEPPAVPEDFEVANTDGDFEVEATWDDTNGATTYRLTWRSIDAGNSLARNTGLPGDSLDTATAGATATVAGSGAWQFSLTACNTGGCSDPAVKTVEVKAVPKQEGVQGQAATALVSNIGQSSTTDRDLDDFNATAQGFTTGSNTGGYTLTSIEVSIGDADGGEAAKLVTGIPGTMTDVVTLNYPSSYSNNTTVTLTPASATTLSANTTYFVWFQNGDGGEVKLTTTNSEDTGAEAGFSIADNSYTQAHNQQSWVSNGSEILIRVNGSAIDNTAPTVTSATVNAAGTQMTVTFSEPLNNSPYQNVDWTYTVDGGSPRNVTSSTGIQNRNSANPHLIFQNLSPTITAGQVVKLNYSQNSNSAFRIFDTANLQLASFTDFAVTNNSTVPGATPPTQTPSTPTTQQPQSDDDDRVQYPGPWISPKVHRADVSGRTVFVTMDKPVALASGSTWAQLAGAFVVRVEGARHYPTAASVVDNGRKLQLTMAAAFSAPGCPKMSVEYTKGHLVDPGDDERRQVETFGLYEPGTCVTPKPNATWISGQNVVLNMDKRVTLNSAYPQGSSAAAASFTVYVNRVRHTPVGVYVNWRDVTLDMGAGFNPPQDAKLSVEYQHGAMDKPLIDTATGLYVSDFGIY